MVRTPSRVTLPTRARQLTSSAWREEYAGAGPFRSAPAGCASGSHAHAWLLLLQGAPAPATG